MKIMFFFILGPCLFCAAAMADDAARLDTLTVTARPPGMGNLEHIAQPIDVLSGDKLDKVKAASIGETLANEPGVSETAFGPYASRPIIRGLGGTRVLMLQNGISSMDVST